LKHLRRIQIVRRDWCAVVLELHGLGMSDTSIAAALHLRDSTVRNWKYGAEPVHSTGEALLKLREECIARAKEEVKLARKAERERLRRSAGKQAAAALRGVRATNPVRLPVGRFFKDMA